LKTDFKITISRKSVTWGNSRFFLMKPPGLDEILGVRASSGKGLYLV